MTPADQIKPRAISTVPPEFTLTAAVISTFAKDDDC